MPASLEFISFVPWTFIAMLANVYILYRVIRHFLFKPVQDILEKRQIEVDTIYGDANELKLQVQSIKEEYNEKLKNVGVEAKEIVASAVSVAKRQEEEILLEANAQAKHIVKKAEEDISQMQRKATTMLKEDISQMAVDIASKVAKKEISKEDHSRLIDECIEDFRGDLA
jgi:ATP synthase, F0 subunit b